MEQEIWKVIPIPELEGRYEASSLGRVRSLFGSNRKARTVAYVLKQQLNGRSKATAYFEIHFRGSGSRKDFTCGVHRMVLSAFVGLPPSPCFEAAHLDGNPQNNRPENLAWKSVKDNSVDRDRHGRQARGEAIVNAKYTADRVREILRSTEPHFVIGRRMGISPAYIGNVRRGVVWAHIYAELGGWIGGRPVLQTSLEDQIVDVARGAGINLATLASRSGEQEPA